MPVRPRVVTTEKRVLPRCQEAGVPKAGDDVGMNRVVTPFAGQDLLGNTDGADGFVEVAFDGHRAAIRLGCGNSGARCSHVFGRFADGLGHAACGVGIDDSDMHGFPGSIFW